MHAVRGCGGPIATGFEDSAAAAELCSAPAACVSTDGNGVPGVLFRNSKLHITVNTLGTRFDRF